MRPAEIATHQFIIIFIQLLAAFISVAAGSIWPFFVMHAAMCAAYWLSRRNKLREGEAADFYHFLSLVFSIPFLGAPLYLYAAGVIASRMRGAKSVLRTELEDHIKAEWEPYAELGIAPPGSDREHEGASPIIDLLSGADDETKRRAIIVLHKMRTPKAVGLLKHALNDPSVEIKFMAASALLSIENEFKDLIRSITARLDEAPAEGASKKAVAEIRYELSCAISKYIRSGLLDDASARSMQQTMFSGLQAAIAEDSEHHQAKILLAEEYSKIGMYSEALSIISPIAGDHALLRSLGERRMISVVTLYCDVLYNMDDFEKLRGACELARKTLTEEMVSKHHELEGFGESVKYFTEAR